MPDEPTASSRFLSLVVPMYEVGSYIGEFLDSLTQQTLNRGFDPTIEMVVVDDGSTDASAEILHRWMAEHAWFDVRYVRQENQGPCVARNVGIALARGTWVTWPDPDDVLRPDYLEVALAQVAELPEDVCLAAARILLLKPDLTVTDSHPLRAKFHRRSQVVDLDHQPELIQLQAASAFYRRSVITDAGLELDPEVRPNFEDAYFTALFLDAAPSRRIALMPDAHYVYRRRDDGTSLVQQSWGRREKYTHLPRTGYLRLFEIFAARHGSVPVWVQNLVLYDLLFYFREDARMHAATAGLSEEVCAEFHALVGRILAHVDDTTLAGFAVSPTSTLLKQALSIGYRHPTHVPERVHVYRIDRRQQIAQVRYAYGSEAPREEIWVDGEPAAPVHGKIRDLSYFGRVLAHERIFWVPATASLRLTLDGRDVPLETGRPRSPALELMPEQLWRTLAGSRVPTPLAERSGSSSAAPDLPSRIGRRVRGSSSRLRKRLGRGGSRPAGARSVGAVAPADARVLRHVGSRAVRRRFARAWVFMDRLTMAQDSAEHLYRWVARHHPEVNAWFVLHPSSPDWTRLLREGFRLVDPDSDDYVAVMKHAENRISSHVDRYVVEPIDPARFGEAGGRFTFLQHGVIKDDLSRWLDSKPISLMVTTTRDEYASVVGDHTPYFFTSKEIGLLGLPRHDRLLALAQERVEPPRRLLLAPTWRRELVGEAVAGDRRDALPGFWSSDYMQAWLAVLESPEVRDFAARNGLVLSFLPHPNMDELIGSGLPAHVDLLRWRDHDMQRVLADSALMITDYSSMAFEQALLNRPVVYYQYDRGAIFGGTHIGRRGSWSYEADGFGPVASSLPQLVDALQQHHDPGDGLRGEERYRLRAEEAFPFRDGKNCERVYERILTLRAPASEAGRDFHSRQGDPGLVPPELHQAVLVEETMPPVEAGFDVAQSSLPVAHDDEREVVEATPASRA